MAFSKGQKISAVDYNVLVSSTNKIFADNYPASVPTSNPTDLVNQAFGWGNVEANYVSIGTKISATLANEIIDRLNISSEHTGGEYELDRVITGQKITAQIWADIETVLADVTPNKNTAALGQTAISQFGTIPYAAGFDNSLTYTVNLTFDSFNKARYYFNSGSSIRLNLDTTGGNALSLFWLNVYERLGTVSLSLTNTLSTTSNIISENKGFEDLNETNQLLLTCYGASDGGYGYGYGSYGYGSYGYGSYGYGSGGSSRNIKIYGKLIPTSGNFAAGPVTLQLLVVLNSSDSGVTGTHTLYIEGNNATSKSSGSADFSIDVPAYNGSASV